MKSYPAFFLRAALVALVCLLAVEPTPVVALERGAYSMEVLVDGVPLAEYPTRERAYIEASEGREYAIRLTNHTNRRIAVALSVDGLNTIDAKSTSAGKASKWILGPYGTVTVSGWQTGLSTARRFFFTTEDRSYGAWLGKIRNLGLISAAVFREQQRPQPIAPSPGSRRSRSGGESESAAPQERLKQEAGRDAAGMAEPSDDMAATGIGREIEHDVRRVRFEAEKSPATVLEVRYEYYDALVRLGVLPQPYTRQHDPLQRRESARGFDGMDFAPDPFRR